MTQDGQFNLLLLISKVLILLTHDSEILFQTIDLVLTRETVFLVHVDFPVLLLDLVLESREHCFSTCIQPLLISHILFPRHLLLMHVSYLRLLHFQNILQLIFLTIQRLDLNIEC